MGDMSIISPLPSDDTFIIRFSAKRFIIMMDALLIFVPKTFPLFLMVATTCLSSCYGYLDVACLDSEKQTLLSFKKGLEDASNRLSSWNVEADCCLWAGVVCNNLTSHVLELHLQNPYYTDYIARA
ncbi:hypothetical protein Vadar_008619 [Vaccinium darrowii]|uniref:Uncharacterized protein n=1 Tax=Vaccinium darrowii TaxID=229202 RepID=A0ACB7YKR5_9ERIC|nr:hypothetical protein Vadar_008619 [Vaccinium darrowii]